MSTNTLVYRVRSQYMLAITQPSECNKAERKEAKRALRKLAWRLHASVKEARQLVVMG